MAGPCPVLPLQPPSPCTGVPGTMLGWDTEVFSWEDEVQTTLRKEGLTFPCHGRERHSGS